MDTKNDDSVGSDSLDKTLQQKCKVDDIGQCEGATTTTIAGGDMSNSLSDKIEIAAKENNSNDEEMCSPKQTTQHNNSNNHQTQLKTDTYSMSEGINAAATEARESSLRFFKASSTITSSFARDDNEDNDDDEDDDNDENNDEGHEDISDTCPSSLLNNNLVNRTNNTNTITASASTDSAGSSSLLSSTSSPSDRIPPSKTTLNNTETNISQISKNLNDTKLEFAMETDSASTSGSTIAANISDTDVSTSSIVHSNSTNIIAEQNLPTEMTASSSCASKTQDNSTESVDQDDDGDDDMEDDDDAQTPSTPNDSMDDGNDQRSKKVRFHPDAKENDGGNRVIPKKKKKLKTTPSSSAPQPPTTTQTSSSSISAASTSSTPSSQPSTSAAAAAATPIAPAPVKSTSASSGGGCVKVVNTDSEDDDDDDDDGDDDDEEPEEEEEINLAQVIAEAEAFIKENPITFVPSNPAFKSHETFSYPLPPGLMDENDLEKMFADDNNDDGETKKDEAKLSTATTVQFEEENGIACILGTKVTNEKVSYLVRYVDQSRRMTWEPEDFIYKNCPNLYNQYLLEEEIQNCQMMTFISNRQNLRQRYTDF